MDGRRAQLIDPALGEAPRLTHVERRPVGVPLGRLKTGWAAVLGLGLPLAFGLATIIEPAPDEPDAGPGPMLVELAALVFVTALVITAVTAAYRLRVAAVAGAVAALVMVAFTVACPVSGHHSYGLWWWGQLGLGVVMLGASLAALGRRARAVS